MNIKKAKRTRKTIECEWVEDGAKFDSVERENPLPEFNKTFDALAPVAAAVCHFPKSYATGLRVVGLILQEMGGTEAVQFICRKDIDDAQKEFQFKTPPRLLTAPVQEGKYTPPLRGEDAALVQEAIEAAKAYIRGDRAQGTIAFEGEEEADDGSGLIEPADEPLDLKTA
jgi:hypothetical protein